LLHCERGQAKGKKARSAKDGIEAKVVPHGRKLAVIGLGYVGLPVAVAFGREGTRVIGFDIDSARIAELKAAIARARSSRMILPARISS
jgi:threonine dehydrogenase-like Zn-dependent dehydrogenase